MAARALQLVMTMMLIAINHIRACPVELGCKQKSTTDCWCHNVPLARYPVFPLDQPSMFIVNTSLDTISRPALLQARDKLRMLYLNDNRLRYQGLAGTGGGFQLLDQLQKLDLSNNLFSSIRPEMFSGMSSLETLVLNNNRISRIYTGAFANLTGLKDLQLRGNRLNHVPQIVGVPSLKKLVLDSNQISSLQYSFLKLHKLEKLTLANNKLTILSGENFPKENRIQSFDASGNPFLTAPDAISAFPIIRELILSNCSLESWPDHLFDDKPNIKNVDLTDNDLRTTGQYFIPTTHTLNTIKIMGNPWRCDCNLNYFVHLATIHKSSFFDMEETVCSEPRSKRGMSLQRFVSNFKDMNCPNFIDINKLRPAVGAAGVVPQVDGVPAVPASARDDLCASVRCANGGTCRQYVDGNVRCSCAVGWKGQSCELKMSKDEKLLTTTPPPKPNQLHVEVDETTRTSVTIGLPGLRVEYNLRVTEISPLNGGLGKSRSYRIRPGDTFYKVQGLRAATKYRVCLASLGPHRDELCNTVETAPAQVVVVPPLVPPSDPAQVDADLHIPRRSPAPHPVPDNKPPADRDPKVDAPEVDQTPVLVPDDSKRLVDLVDHPKPAVPSVDDSQDSVKRPGQASGSHGERMASGVVDSEALQPDQSVYLLIGAGIGAVVILVFGAVLLLFLRKKKRKLSRAATASSSGGTGTDSSGASSGGSDDRRYADIGAGCETEMAPLHDTRVHHHHQQQRTTPSPSTSNVVYFKPQQQILYHPHQHHQQPEVYHQLTTTATDTGSCRTGASSPAAAPARSTGGSLGRSSVSGSGMSALFDHHRGYSPLTNTPAAGGAGEPCDDIQYVAVTGRYNPMPLYHVDARARHPSVESRRSPLAPAVAPAVARTTSVNQYHPAAPIVASRVVSHPYASPAAVPSHQVAQQRASRHNFGGAVPMSECYGRPVVPQV